MEGDPVTTTAMLVGLALAIIVAVCLIMAYGRAIERADNEDAAREAADVEQAAEDASDGRVS